MADIVSIIGNKGGTGKTTLSHLLAYGIGLLEQRAIAVLTDSLREPLDPRGRNYVIADARTPEALKKVTDKIQNISGWIGIIDGGGNRLNMDIVLYQSSDLVLLPFRDSQEDIRTVLGDMELFPNAYALPSQWPTVGWQREAANRMVKKMLANYRHRVLPPINIAPNTKLLLQKKVPSHLPVSLRNMARAFAAQVLKLRHMPFDPARVYEIESGDMGSMGGLLETGVVPQKPSSQLHSAVTPAGADSQPQSVLAPSAPVSAVPAFQVTTQQNQTVSTVIKPPEVPPLAAGPSPDFAK